MDAGEELDAFIAKKLMEWTQENEYIEHFPWHDVRADQWHNLPYCYSTDWHAAKDVVAELIDSGNDVHIKIGTDSIVDVGIVAYDEYGWQYPLSNARAETFPHALCLAVKGLVESVEQASQ